MANDSVFPIFSLLFHIHRCFLQGLFIFWYEHCFVDSKYVFISYDSASKKVHLSFVQESIHIRILSFIICFKMTTAETNLPCEKFLTRWNPKSMSSDMGLRTMFFSHPFSSLFSIFLSTVLSRALSYKTSSILW